jgi:plasmid stabilization system protein ParE
VPEVDSNDVREIVVGRYRVIYLLRGADVRIVMILHGARLLDRGELADRL